MTDRKLLKEARDLILLCSLLDKSNQCNDMVDKIDNHLGNHKNVLSVDNDTNISNNK